MEHQNIIQALHTAGKRIRDTTIAQTLGLKEAELIKTRQAEGDEEFTIDMKPAEILEKALHEFGKKNNVRIELIGEGFSKGYKGRVVGEGDLKFIVHADVLDGTRETTHKVGISYFEAGVLPWSKEPRLSDTIAGLAVAVGYDPLTGKLYSYFSDSKGSYCMDEEGNKERLQPTKEKEFIKGYFNTITSFRGTGILTVLKDRIFEKMYGKPESPDVFHREILTSCGELINIAKGSTRGAMDLRPAVSVIAKKLGIEGYKSPVGLCMHPYDVSGVWLILRNTKAAIAFFDKNLKEIKPKEIPIRDVKMDIGYIACGNQELFDKVIKSLKDVLGNKYF